MSLILAVTAARRVTRPGLASDRFRPNACGMVGFTFRQLEVFVALVEADSFRACADRLSISPEEFTETLRGEVAALTG